MNVPYSTSDQNHSNKAVADSSKSLAPSMRNSSFISRGTQELRVVFASRKSELVFEAHVPLAGS